MNVVVVIIVIVNNTIMYEGRDLRRPRRRQFVGAAADFCWSARRRQ